MTRPTFTVERRSLTRRNDLEDMVQDAIAVVRAETIDDEVQAALARIVAAVPADQHHAAFRRLREAVNEKLGVRRAEPTTATKAKPNAARVRAEALFPGRAA